MQQTVNQLFNGDVGPVIVIGDIMVDRYLFGSVHRISPEAPVPVVAYEGENCLPGGAANVALNLKSLDIDPILIAVCGEDAEKDTLLRALDTAGLHTDLLIAEKGRRTTVKTRILAGSQHLLRVDREDTHPVSADTMQRILHNLHVAVTRHRPIAILLQDYDKGLFTPALIQQIVTMANDAGIPVSVDPKFRNFLAYKGVDLFKPNLKELVEGLGHPVQPTEADLVHATEELHRMLQHRVSLITLSEKGVFWCDHERKRHGLVKPVVRDIVDVCGAGDTVIAVATVAVAQGLELDEVARLANLAGGQVCEFPGVVPVDKVVLAREYGDQVLPA